jgi:hypothetical protein
MSQLSSSDVGSSSVGMQVRTLALSELQVVLSYLNENDLPRIARVSSVWYRAIDSPLVWKHLIPSVVRLGSPALSDFDLMSVSVFTGATHGFGVPNRFRSDLVRRRMPVTISIHWVLMMEAMTADKFQRLVAHLGQLGCIVRLDMQATAYEREQIQQTLSLEAFRNVLRMQVDGEWAQPHVLQAAFSTCTRLKELHYRLHKSYNHGLRPPLDAAVFAEVPPSLQTICLQTHYFVDQQSWMVLARMPHLTHLAVSESSPYVAITEAFSTGAGKNSGQSLFIFQLTMTMFTPFLPMQFDGLPNVFAMMSNLRLIQMRALDDDISRCGGMLQRLAGLPPEVPPHLQHVVLDPREGSLRGMYEDALAHLPKLIESRPLERFTLHLRQCHAGCASEFVTVLPCVFHPYDTDGGQPPIDLVELARMDAIVKARKGMPKYEIVALIEQEREALALSYLQ